MRSTQFIEADEHEMSHELESVKQQLADARNREAEYLWTLAGLFRYLPDELMMPENVEERVIDYMLAESD